MKKSVTEERTFCDFCPDLQEQPGYSVCLVCGKDLCQGHRLEMNIYLMNQGRTFQASLCPKDAEPLLPILTTLQGKGESPAHVLADILQFIERGLSH